MRSNKNYKLLVVDDEEAICKLVQGLLEDEGYSVDYALNMDSACRMFDKDSYDLCILDVWLNDGDEDGLLLMQELLKKAPALPIVMMSGHSTVETAVQAIKKGAYDFIEKPFKTDRLLVMVQRGLELRSLKNENKNLKNNVASDDEGVVLVGDSPVFKEFKRNLLSVANVQGHVAVIGDDVGEQVQVAKYIHQNSVRNQSSCLLIDCAVSKALLVSRFLDNKPENSLANVSGGTLILKNYHLLDNDFRAPLLKAMSASSVRSIIIESSESVIFDGTSITVPSLSDRHSDIVSLIDYYYECTGRNGQISKKMTEMVLATLTSYSWPGGISQLKNFVEWLIIVRLDCSSKIDLPDLPSYFMDDGINGEEVRQQFFEECMSVSLKDAREKFEKIYLEEQLVRFEYNISKASGFIGMERSALHRKLKSLNITTSSDVSKIQKSRKEA